MHGFKLKKLNNAGMSFVELLAAIVILSIVVAPFLHSYITTANTNSKARNAMNGSSLAQNVMEEFEAYSLAELQTLTNDEGDLVFTTTTTPGSNKIKMTTDGSHYASGMSGYSIEVELNPDATAKYTAANGKNVSDVLEMKPDAFGLYAMMISQDRSAYDIFAARSEAAAIDDTFARQDWRYFQQNLSREIVVTFTTRGNLAVVKDGVDTTIQHVAVSIDINYTLPNAKKVVTLPTGATKKVLQSASDCKYSVHKDIYDNASSKVEFESIYILYTPRYTENTIRDVVRVVNRSNIEGTCFIMREETTGDNGAGPYNLVTYKPDFYLEENPVWGPGCLDITGKKSAMRMRTNLFNDVSVAGIKFNPYYKTLSNTFGPTADNTKLLDLMSYQTADGRNFTTANAKTRIYSISVTVKKGTETVTTLTGTKTD